MAYVIERYIKHTIPMGFETQKEALEAIKRFSKADPLAAFKIRKEGKRRLTVEKTRLYAPRVYQNKE